jgi:hypothetical protein
MKIIKNTFDPEVHERALQSFNVRLKECGYNTPEKITRVIIDPLSIARIDEAVLIKDKDFEAFILGNLMTVQVLLNALVLKVYSDQQDVLEVKGGVLTPKGYRSQKSAVEQFIVNQQLALTASSLEKMEGYVHEFKVWKESATTRRNSQISRNSGGKVYGYPTDLFGGDASSYWNID